MGLIMKYKRIFFFFLGSFILINFVFSNILTDLNKAKANYIFNDIKPYYFEELITNTYYKSIYLTGTNETVGMDEWLTNVDSQTLINLFDMLIIEDWEDVSNLMRIRRLIQSEEIRFGEDILNLNSIFTNYLDDLNTSMNNYRKIQFKSIVRVIGDDPDLFGMISNREARTLYTNFKKIKDYIDSFIIENTNFVQAFMTNENIENAYSNLIVEFDRRKEIYLFFNESESNDQSSLEVDYLTNLIRALKMQNKTKINAKIIVNKYYTALFHYTMQNYRDYTLKDDLIHSEILLSNIVVPNLIKLNMNQITLLLKIASYLPPVSNDYMMTNANSDNNVSVHHKLLKSQLSTLEDMDTDFVIKADTLLDFYFDSFLEPLNWYDGDSKISEYQAVFPDLIDSATPSSVLPGFLKLYDIDSSQGTNYNSVDRIINTINRFATIITDDADQSKLLPFVGPFSKQIIDMGREVKDFYWIQVTNLELTESIIKILTTAKQKVSSSQTVRLKGSSDLSYLAENLYVI